MQGIGPQREEAERQTDQYEVIPNIGFNPFQEDAESAGGGVIARTKALFHPSWEEAEFLSEQNVIPEVSASQSLIGRG